LNAKKLKKLRRAARMATVGAPYRLFVAAKPGSRVARVHPQTTRGIYLALKRTES
jgi:hypothetical protein